MYTLLAIIISEAVGQTMSYRVHAMGLDRELAKKINDKYSEDDEEELMEWIIAVLSDCPNLKYPEGQGKKVSSSITTFSRL